MYQMFLYIELIDDHKSLFQHIFHKISSVKLPSNWFSNIEILKNEYMICFHTLSNLRSDLTRYIKKQLFISNGLLIGLDTPK